MIKFWEGKIDQGYLSLQDFTHMVLPHDNSMLRANVTQRPQRSVLQTTKASEVSFFNVLRLEIELQHTTNNHKSQLEKENDYSVISLFSQVDKGGYKYIDWEILMKFMLD